LNPLEAVYDGTFTQEARATYTAIKIKRIVGQVMASSQARHHVLSGNRLKLGGSSSTAGAVRTIP
jgi:hypothetical protein